MLDLVEPLVSRVKNISSLLEQQISDARRQEEERIRKRKEAEEARLREMKEAEEARIRDQGRNESDIQISNGLESDEIMLQRIGD